MNPVALENLEIIGYATVLPESLLPSIVPPVFRLKSDPNIHLVPPYRILDGAVCQAPHLLASEILDLKSRGEITLLKTSIPARRGFEMWVDLKANFQYQTRKEVEDSLNSIARQSIDKALKALRSGKLDDAEKLSSIALSANDRMPEPLAIKAALCKMRGDSTGALLMSEMAESLVTPDTFYKLMEDYTKLGKPPKRTDKTEQPLEVARVRIRGLAIVH